MHNQVGESLDLRVVNQLQLFQKENYDLMQLGNQLHNYLREEYDKTLHQ